jgi:N-acetylglucosaminyldiphosphoundecaprenol N-acetyl-beta-D-mannosaminyltransferase
MFTLTPHSIYNCSALRLCETAEKHFISVGFYGGKKQVLDALIWKIQKRYPFLKIVYAYSPPFHALNLAEQNEVVENIKQSGTKILFVGLGCPKQEHWMSLSKQQLPLVMLGVGGAFDVLAGAKPYPPVWIQSLGLEWLFRLCLEPKRLWYRNLYHSSRFLLLIALLNSINLIKNVYSKIFNF